MPSEIWIASLNEQIHVIYLDEEFVLPTWGWKTNESPFYGPPDSSPSNLASVENVSKGREQLVFCNANSDWLSKAVSTACAK